MSGNVAENSSGVHCLKYGLTVDNVLRVRMVTTDGDVVALGSGALDAPGLDLLAIVVGSEGIFGVVTEVTVKLVPKPRVARVVMASFDDIVKAGDALASVIAASIIPAGLEMMDRLSPRRRQPAGTRHCFVAGRKRPACSSRWPRGPATPSTPEKRPCSGGDLQPRPGRVAAARGRRGCRAVRGQPPVLRLGRHLFRAAEGHRADAARQQAGKLEATRPERIVSANIGCITYLQSGIETPVEHWIELLDRALA